jgi:hypothetical protein
VVIDGDRFCRPEYKPAARADKKEKRQEKGPHRVYMGKRVKGEPAGIFRGRVPEFVRYPTMREFMDCHSYHKEDERRQEGY